MNVEMPSVDQKENGDILGKFYFHKYVSEVCINMAPCDFILCVDPLSAVLRNMSVITSSGAKRRTSTTEVSTVVDDVEPMPLMTSSNLPLLYADIACVRLFLPDEDKVVSDEQESKHGLRTTFEHDLFVLQVMQFDIRFQILESQ